MEKNVIMYEVTKPPIKIEKRVPIPPKSKNNGFMEAFAMMEIGDSVLIPRTPARLSNLVQKAFGPGAYTMRAVGTAQTRIWRIK